MVLVLVKPVGPSGVGRRALRRRGHGITRSLALQKRLGDLDDVRDELPLKIPTKALADHHSQDFGLLAGRRQRIVGHDPANRPELLLHPALLHVWVLLLDLIREAETDHGQAGTVERRVRVVLGLGVFDGDVDLRKNCEEAALLERAGEDARLRQVGVDYAAVPAEAEVEDWVLAMLTQCRRGASGWKRV